MSFTAISQILPEFFPRFPEITPPLIARSKKESGGPTPGEIVHHLWELE